MTSMIADTCSTMTYDKHFHCPSSWTLEHWMKNKELGTRNWNQGEEQESGELKEIDP
jgi:hypothetical protein